MADEDHQGEIAQYDDQIDGMEGGEDEHWGANPFARNTFDLRREPRPFRGGGRDSFSETRSLLEGPVAKAEPYRKAIAAPNAEAMGHPGQRAQTKQYYRSSIPFHLTNPSIASYSAKPS